MLNVEKFRGVFTALVTPLDADGHYDAQRFQKQIDRQIIGGVAGIVPVGTTGESPTLPAEEHLAVIKDAVDCSRGKLVVIAGTGGNSTAEAIELTQAAEKLGVDASLQVVPYYNKPSQAGLIAHFTAIAQSTKLNLILYNIPGRSGVDMLPETVVRIVERCPNVIGIKEASGSCDRVTELRRSIFCPFVILSGDDSLTVPFMAAGADGVISVVSNAVPGIVQSMVAAAEQNNFAKARNIHRELYPLVKSLFLDGNPAGIKYALKLMKVDSGKLRLPLVEVPEKTGAIIRAELEKLSLIGE